MSIEPAGSARMSVTKQIGREYCGLISRGHIQSDAVAILAAKYECTPNLIQKRLHRLGDAVPYVKRPPRRQRVHPQNVGVIPGDEILARRVHRDPCFLCGTRGDVGCRHTRARPIGEIIAPIVSEIFDRAEAA